MGFLNEERVRGRRGLSSVLAIVLLLAMVGLGVVLIFSAGSSMMDALESEAGHERTQQYVAETDHRLITVASTGQDQELPIDDVPDGQVGIVDDGEIEIKWYGGDNDKSVSDSLGALEFDLGDRTIAHQGGGVWEDTGDSVLVNSEPQIEYDGDTLQLTILQINESAVESASEPIARANYTEASKLTEKINTAAKKSDGENVSLRITSSYHEGWYRYLEDELGGHGNVSVSKSGKTVAVDIINARNVSDRPQLLLEDDLGLKHTVGDERQRVEFGTPLKFRAALENTGDEKVTPDYMTVSIDGTSLTASGGNGTIHGPDRVNRRVGISPGSYKNHLTPGNTYEYMIETKDGSKLDESGSFYIGKSGTHFNVTDDDIDIETTDGDENATIDVSVSNVGVLEGKENVTISFDGFEANNTKDLRLDYGATGSVEWTVNRSTLPPGANDFTVTIGDRESPVDTATASIRGTAGGDGAAYVVVADEGITDGGVDDEEQVIADDGTEFTIGAEVLNTYPAPTDDPVTLTIPDAGVEVTKTPTVPSGNRSTVSFNLHPDEHAFEHGTVYEYNVSADGNGLQTPGSFYFGTPGTSFELSNGNVTVDENVTLTADLHNVGVSDGEQNVSLELEYGDEMPAELEDENLYGYLDEREVERSFGQNGTIDFELNQSNLLSGSYNATIRTNDDEIRIPFEVDTGVDPGRTGLGEIENSNVTVEVLGTQVSGDGSIGGGWFTRPTPVHNLAPMTLDVVANGETEHSFENPERGANINIGPTWQDKTDESYTYEFSIEDETELTLRNTRYPTCQDESTNPTDLDHYTGPTDRDLMWCTDVRGYPSFGPIDASQDRNLQNVRVRSAENNTIPALPAGTDQQLSATEVLEKRGLVEEGDNELDLGPGEFVFLFENTESTNEDGIDALWNEAIDAYEEHPDRTHDPNFNDLIVYVEVERADVDPGRPSIVISPDAGDATEVGSGEGTDPGPTDVEPEFGDGTTDEGEAPFSEPGPGEADPDHDAYGGETGIELDNEYIVVE